MRRLFCLLLLVCLPLQSLASQTAGAWAASLALLTHDTDPAAQLHHHHEEDGSVHYDNSDESVEHADEHSAAPQLIVLASSVMQFSHVAATLADYPDPASYLPEPCLEDPPRPPSFAPGLAAGG